MKKEKTFLYTIARGIAAVIYRVIFPTKARGMENFPTNENFIVLSNHISAWDPITIARYYRTSEIHFMAKESLYKNKLLAALLNKLHAFPVNRGKADMTAMRTAMQIIHDGYVLGIFPEGHRQHNDCVQSIESGVAVLALRTDVPLIPVVITGKYRFGGRIRVVIGPPIDIADLRAGPPDTPTVEAVKTRIIDAVEALRPLAAF